MNSLDDLLSTRQAAKVLAIKPSTLVLWRSNARVRLPYVRIGGAIRYRVSDLLRLIDENTEAGAEDVGS